MENENSDVFARAFLFVKECQLAKYGIKAELSAVKVEQKAPPNVGASGGAGKKDRTIANQSTPPL